MMNREICNWSFGRLKCLSIWTHMEANHGSVWRLFLALTRTHAFHLILHPGLPNAALDYCSRIWIYLRQAPIKLQIDPINPPLSSFFWRGGVVSEIPLSVVGSITGQTRNKKKRAQSRKAHMNEAFVWVVKVQYQDQLSLSWFLKIIIPPS